MTFNLVAVTLIATIENISRETCVFKCLFESIMAFKPQECGISYLIVKGENILFLCTLC